MSYTFGKNFVDGVGRVIEIFPDVDYVYPSKRGFAEDAAHLRGDARKVGNNIRESIKKYGR